MKFQRDPEKIKLMFIVISTAFAVFMANLDGTIVNISLPTIERAFKVDSGKIAWVLLIYLLVNTSLLLLFGKLGDKIGIKRVFMSGYIVFITGSLFCGLSHGIYALIASRAFQGIGAAMLASVSMAIISKFLPKEKTGAAFGVLAVAAALGITFGAPLGGFITSFWGWNWIFLINVPVGIAAFIIAGRAIPYEVIDEKHKKTNFDFIGALLSFVTLTTLIYGINMAQELGWTSSVIAVFFAVSIISGIVFIIWEVFFPDPLLHFKVFANRAFTFSALAAFAGFMFIAGTGFLFPFYLELGMGLKAYQAGLLLTLFSSIIMFTGFFFGRLSDKASPRALCVWGMFFSGVGTLIFSFLLNTPKFFPIVFLLIWLAFSNAMFISPNNKLAMNSVPVDIQGISASVFRMMMNLGLILGICLSETIFSSSLPQGAVLDIANLGANISRAALFTGFRNAFLFTAIACFAASVLSLFTKKLSR